MSFFCRLTASLCWLFVSVGGGGGLAVSESDPQGSVTDDALQVGPAVTITNSQFSDCSAAPYGGGIYLTAAMSALTVTGVTITRCSAIDGGGQTQCRFVQ